QDPQLMAWIEIKRAQLVAAGLSAAQADLVVQRKATCRQSAQWEIHVVDQRDSDAIMTPFEYDENPWDGWGVTINANTGEIIPLDGDPATDENAGKVIDWSKAPT